MPSVSKKQHNFMAAVASNPKFAKKVGVPRSVGEEFLTADKGKKFKQGGEMKKKMRKFQDGGETSAKDYFMERMAQKPKSDLDQLRSNIKSTGRAGMSAAKEAVDSIPQVRGAKELASRISQKSMPKSYDEERGMKKGGNVKKMAAGGPAMDPRAAAMMRKRAMMGARPDQMQNRPTMGRPISPTAAPAPTMPMKKGGRIASKGEHPVQKQSKRGAEIVKMAGGGYVKSADGIAKKGKTKATMVKMAGGGMGKKYC